MTKDEERLFIQISSRITQLREENKDLREEIKQLQFDKSFWKKQAKGG